MFVVDRLTHLQTFQHVLVKKKKTNGGWSAVIEHSASLCSSPLGYMGREDIWDMPE